MSLILPANSLTGGYEIDNSLRFNDGSSDYLNRTFSSSPTNRRIFTFSTWVKRGELSDYQTLIGADVGSGLRDTIRFNNNDVIHIFFNEVASASLITTQVFRDVSAWYHIVMAVDTTQATASNRIKLYVNGEQVTSFSTASYPSQNYDPSMNYGVVHNIGKDFLYTEYFDGYMSETYFIDGQALTPTDFGEFDQDTGIWKPIKYTGTYGTNGFYLDFENSGSLGADQSGNGNNFTVNNLTSIDQVTDTPTNNFTTLNPLNVNRWNNSADYSEGNLFFNSANGRGIGVSTMGVTQGKWYWEFKVGATSLYPGVGDATIFNVWTTPFYDNSNSGIIAYNVSGGGVYTDPSSPYAVASYPSASTNDIVSFALDMDNYALYVAKNGTWLNSGDPTSGASKTGDMATASGYTSLLNNGNPMFAVAVDSSSVGHGSCYFDFGNPPFTIASGNSDANGYGNFEYAVPSGYYSLCTKNLAEFG